jgi:hypothetical protein
MAEYTAWQFCKIQGGPTTISLENFKCNFINKEHFKNNYWKAHKNENVDMITLLI